MPNLEGAGVTAGLVKRVANDRTAAGSAAAHQAVRVKTRYAFDQLALSADVACNLETLVNHAAEIVKTLAQVYRAASFHKICRAIPECREQSEALRFPLRSSMATCPFSMLIEGSAGSVGFR